MKISNYFFLITTSLLVFVNTTKVTLTYAYYKLDPIGFIEALCENTDKPELQCNGKCHLKKVAQSQDPKKNTPESIIDFKDVILFLHIGSTVETPFKTRIKKEGFSADVNLYSYKNSKDFFHPPKV